MTPVTFKTISEIGINHNGDLEDCKKLIKVSADCGFTYVKFQKRDPEVCVPPSQWDKLRETPWGTMKYIDYKHRVEFQQAEYDAIDKYCKEVGIQWFASAFDVPSIIFLSQYLKRGTSFAGFIKLGSAACIEMELCEAAAKHFPKVMVSLGMKTEAEIRECVKVANPFCVLHTVSVYPTKNELLFLNYIRRMRRMFPDLELGYSGHEAGLAPTFGAAALGCTWFERHTTLDKNMWGTDQKASLNPEEMQELIQGLREIEAAMSIPAGERYLLPGELEKRSFFVEPAKAHGETSDVPTKKSRSGIVCMIPARGGSKRLPRKNVKLLKKKPLIVWSIEAALQSGVFDGVYVSTDDDEIAAIAQKHGATVHRRAAEAATDMALLRDVIIDFEDTSKVPYDIMMVLNPTNPLRGVGSIQSAARNFQEGGATFLLTCLRQRSYFWNVSASGGSGVPTSGYRKGDNAFSKRSTSELEPIWVECGAIYMARREQWRDQPCTAENTVVMEVDAIEAVDIDHNTDFAVAEVLAEPL